jgi:hypothetical protein
VFYEFQKRRAMKQQQKVWHTVIEESERPISVTILRVSSNTIQETKAFSNNSVKKGIYHFQKQCSAPLGTFQ